ncbi:hypothetical protein RCL1_002099 [Eukaryota sp. TZLM3-RCL]
MSNDYTIALDRLKSSTRSILSNIERLNPPSIQRKTDPSSLNLSTSKRTETFDVPPSPSQRIASNYSPSARHLSPFIVKTSKGPLSHYNSNPTSSSCPNVPLRKHKAESVQALVFANEIDSVLSSMDSTSLPDHGFLPLEFFDVEEVDSFAEQLSTSSVTFSAVSKYYDGSSDSYVWKSCTVISYDPNNLSFSIKWEDGSIKPKVRRSNLIFDSECREYWEKRWEEARVRRTEREKLTRFSVVAEKLKEQLPQLSDNLINLLLLKAGVSDISQVPPFMIKSLTSELKSKYLSSMQLAALSYKLKDFNFACTLSGLNVPNEFISHKPVPEKGLLPIPNYHYSSLKSFLDSRLILTSKTFSPTVINFFSKLIFELESKQLVDLNLNPTLFPVETFSFQQKQDRYLSEIKDFIIFDFASNISNTIREQLSFSINSVIDSAHFGKSTPRVAFVSEDGDAYLLARLIKLLNLSFKDTLRVMVLNTSKQIQSFVQSFKRSNSETFIDFNSLTVNFNASSLPLFRVVLDCSCSIIPDSSPFHFVPSLDILYSTVDSLFEQCLSAVNEIPELSHQILHNIGLTESFLDTTDFNCLLFQQTRQETMELLQGLFSSASNILLQFEQFSQYFMCSDEDYLLEFYKSNTLITNSENNQVKSINNEAEVEIDEIDSPKSEEISEEIVESDNEEEEEQVVVDFSKIPMKIVAKEISRHMELARTVSVDFLSTIKFDILAIDCTRVRSLIAEYATKFANTLMEKVAETFVNNCHLVISEYKSIEAKLYEEPSTPEELHQLKIFIEKLPDSEAVLQKIVDTITEQLNLVDQFFYKHDDNTIPLYAEVLSWPRKISNILFEQQGRIDDVKRVMLTELEQSKTEIHQEIETLNGLVEDLQHEGDVNSAPVLSEKCEEIKSRLEVLASKVELINSREVLFGNEATAFVAFAEIERTFEDFYVLWTMAATINRQIPLWLTGSFITLEPTKISELVQIWNKSLIKRQRGFKELAMPLRVVSSLKDRLKEFNSAVDLISALRSPGLKTRHWDKSISPIVGISVRPSPDLKLQDLIDLDILQHITKLQEVAAIAGREFNIEQNLDKMAKEWEKTEFELKEHDAGTYILRGTDDVVGILDEQIINVQTIRGSPFIKAFEDRARTFEEQLHLMSDTIEQWLMVQKAWMYLEPIFCSDDISRQLPDESKRFSQVNSLWTATMERAFKSPNVFNLCNDEALLQSFISANESLEFIQKGLSDYLETKRQAFPRFYFLSNDGLLEILSETKDPTRVNPHLRSCFEAIDKLEFSEDKSKILAMCSAEGEVVKFDRHVTPSSLIEKWLNDVENVMRSSLRKVVAEALIDYGKTPRDQWVLKWPSQVVLAISQIEWTRGVSEALSSEGTQGLTRYVKLLQKQLDDIIVLVRGDLKTSEQTTISSLIVIDVHNRDIVTKMASEGVSSLEDFMWISQLRYYYEQSTIMIKQVTATVEYGYEYLGNTGRLVITPLTDRCYMTLMSALQLNLGGAPAGPAGTGKTETTKDLAKALAKQCVVYNCSDSLDYLAMAKFFKGLVSSGAWACFDEFNRINLEVLSVVAQQILTIQGAIREKVSTVDFEGSRIKVNPGCAVFITMNPGYAGRTELPENLKALFRPIAMTVPDYSLISEISLMSYGYSDARSLAKKMVSCFQLSSEQLSSQDHYDFGMRAVKTVLTAAGRMMREAVKQSHKGNEDGDEKSKDLNLAVDRFKKLKLKFAAKRNSQV